ncbi:MAG: chromosomal replication initiator protein DnaA [Propionibacteriaceae bacterium]|jgi:chromosomal replication initiator protein|nr:chromosomal replication initiator protein DnaA [Propionibacteriaceae bacterium]
MTFSPADSDPSLRLLWDGLLDSLDGPSRSLLSTCQPLVLTERELDLAVPNDFTRDRIEQRLRPRVEEILLQLTGRPVHLKVEVAADSIPSELPLPPPPLADHFIFDAAPTPFDAASRARSADTERLNPKYTFETFVVGPNNRFAWAAAQAVAEGPGKAFNPLLIYGESGLGKTHLLHAVGHYISTYSSHLSIKYVSTEELTNEFINAISENRTNQFRRTYRDVDVLLIDDIQFLESKIQTQEEFFHTFNTLYNAQKQIVMTCDRPPKLLEALEPRLRSRFESGLLADIQPADLETRIAILRNKAAAERLAVAPDVLEFIASRIHTNIRELEGALIRVTAFASLNQQQVDVALAEIVLRDLIPEGVDRPITPSMIMTQTADQFSLTLDDLTGSSRSTSVALARQIAMYLCRELTELSLPKIGAQFERDHTTVMHAYRKISALILTDRAVFTTVTEITNGVKHRAQMA